MLFGAVVVMTDRIRVGFRSKYSEAVSPAEEEVDFSVALALLEEPPVRVLFRLETQDEDCSTFQKTR